MSSPAGLHSFQADLVARWMPSSSRAGVILCPSSDVVGGLRNIIPVGSSDLTPDDSFASDFAQLPASADSSYLSLDRGEKTGTKNLNVAPTHPNGDSVTFNEMASAAQDLPLIMKLEQLRKWQQHMQEQLKAHQLEELLHLQEEQQRLLGIMNESQHCKRVSAENAELSGANLADETPQKYREISTSPTVYNVGVQPGSSFDHQEEKQLSLAVKYKHVSEGLWNSREDDLKQSEDASCCPDQVDTFIQCNGVSSSEDNGKEVWEAPHDRPIRPGVGGRTHTFEELLEEQLQLEEQRLQVVRLQKSTTDTVQQAPPKRIFLRRGEGLSRYTNNCKSVPKKQYKAPKPQIQPRLISRSNSEPASFLKLSTGVCRPPIHRKTATHNKENQVKGPCLTSHGGGIEGKPGWNVLCSRQKQNAEGSESVKAGSQGKRHKTLWQEKGQGNRGLPDQKLHSNQTEKPMSTLERAETGPAGAKNSAVKAVIAGDRGDSEPPQDSFELSFKEKLKLWENNQQVESMELGEFELLEQAAEELSFSSNSSFVMKVLQMDRQRQRVDGLHLRRLSSTPIKSPPKYARKGSGSEGSSVDEACKSSSVNPQEPGELITSRSDDHRAHKEKSAALEENADASDAFSCNSSEFGEAEVADTCALSFPAQSHPPYDKHLYEIKESSRESASTTDLANEHEDQSDCTLSHMDDSTLIEDGDAQQRRVVFDDDDTWNDMEETSSTVDDIKETVSNQNSPQMKTLVRKVATSKVTEPLKEANTQEEDTPPGSQLMIRLFPSLKPKTQNAPLSHSPVATTTDKTLVEETGRQIHSGLLRQRVAELEIEIERFKKENAALAKLRQESEMKQENLRKERLEFEQMKAKELAEFEEYKKEENRKLQKERKLFEKHAAASRAIPDKKEREEILVLKQQLGSLQEELKRRESRWSLAQSRLRQQIDSLSQENLSLRDEIRMLEKLRLSAWKKDSLAAEETETKEAPKIVENTVSSVTKGVTFASPLDSGRRRSSSSSSPPQSNAVSNRRSSKDAGQPAAGMKSSLRKPLPGSSPSSSSSSSRRTEEKSASVGRSNDTQPQQRAPHSSSPRDSETKEEELIETSEPESAKEVITHPDGKVEKVLVNGDRLIVFPNGTRKEVSADGQSVKVTFFNGDTKQVTADQRVIYFYAEAQTTHITYPDGIEVLHFPNNQTEKHFPGGRKEITFPDQTVKNLFPDGREESVLTDGTIIQVNPDGTKEIHFNTGQKEIHTAEFKQREYPDGTVKTVYTDGRQETRYATGRLRIKDKEGNVIVDNMP